MELVGEKRCPRCARSLPVDAFWKRRDRKNGDGLQSKCKDCARETKRETRDRHLDEARARQREYRHANRDRINERKRQAYHALKAENPELVRERARDQYRRFKTRYRSYQREYQRDRVLRGKAFIDELKAKPCHDCGGLFPPVCMDFDHVPGRGVKFRGLSRMWAYRPERIMAEVAKCDLVCANCHRVRTAERARAHRVEAV